MKKQWLLVFPMFLLLISMVSCIRGPYGASVYQTPDAMAPAIFAEVGGVQHFVFNQKFTLHWCTNAACDSKEDGDNPCEAGTQLESHKEKHGDLYVVKCKIKKDAVTSTVQMPNHYYYQFLLDDEKHQPLTTHGYPDTIHPCNPPCFK